MATLNEALAERMEQLLRRLAGAVNDHSPDCDIAVCGMIARAIEMEAWQAFYDFTGFESNIGEWDELFNCPELDDDGSHIEQAILHCVSKPQEPV